MGVILKSFFFFPCVPFGLLSGRWQLGFARELLAFKFCHQKKKISLSLLNYLHELASVLAYQETQSYLSVY